MLSQYKCMVIGHDEQQIIGICENVNCKQQYRRVCLDCQQTHQEKDLQFKLTDIKNEKGIQKLLDEFQQENIIKINHISTQCYIQQYFLTLKLIEQVEQYILKYSQFDNILDDLDKFQQKELKLVNIIDYLQNEQSIGIFKYLQQIQDQLQIIDQAKDNNILNINNRIENQIVQNQSNYKQWETLWQSILILQINMDNIFQLIVKNNLYGNEQVNQNPLQSIELLIYNQGKNLITNILKEQYNQIDNLLLKGGSQEGQQQLLQEEQSQLMDDRINQENKQKLIQFKDEGGKPQNLKRYQEAIDMYDQAIKLDPKHVNAYYNKGVSLQNLKRYQEAIDMYDQAIKLDPKYVNAYINKGVSLQNLKRYQEAIDMYDQAIKLDPKHVNAYYNKGCSLKQMGKKEDAKATFKQCLQIDPNNSIAKSQSDCLIF